MEEHADRDHHRGAAAAGSGARAGSPGRADRRHRRRGAHAWDAVAGQAALDGLSAGSPNRLLVHAVLDTTNLNAYLPRVEAFLGWAEERRIPLGKPEPELMDIALADCMAELLYLHQEGITSGANLLSGVLHIWPQLSGRLPRAARALAAWRKVDPSGAGEALCAEVMVVMAARLRERSSEGAEAADIMLTMFDTYCRQQDIFQLRREDVSVTTQPFRVAVHFGISARGESTKTGTDQGVIIDYVEIARMLSVRACAPAVRPENGAPEMLFSLSRKKFHELYYSAAASLGIRVPPPHSLRHTGPSRDAFLGFRTLSEIQVRGRWAALASVQRYSKPAWYNSLLAQVPDEILSEGRELLNAFSRSRPTEVCT